MNEGSISPLTFKEVELKSLKNLRESAFKELVDKEIYLMERDTDIEKKKYNLFYDKYSNVIILIEPFSSEINVFNRKCTRLLKLTRLKNPIKLGTPIYASACDSLANFILILSKQKNSNSILIASLEKGERISSIEVDFKDLLGMFFIDNSKMSVAYSVGFVFFCLVFTNKIVLYQISYSNLSAKVVKKIPVSGEYHSFSYNRHYKVLCCQKSDKKNIKHTFDFYNLSDQKFFGKSFPLKININNVKNKKFENKKIISTLLSRNKEYSALQFHLVDLYNKLYFIWLNCIEAKMSFYEIKNLECNVLSIELDIKNNISYLQFIDNMVILHDMENFTSYVIDISDRNFIYVPEIPMTKMESSNNQTEEKYYPCPSIYQNEIHFDGKVIYENCKEGEYENKIKMYIINFDTKIYIRNIDRKHLILTLPTLTRRKTGVELLESMILNNILNNTLPYEIIKEIFSKFAELIKAQKDIKTAIRECNTNIAEISMSGYFSYPKRKNIATQEDLCNNIFRPLKEKSNFEEKTILMVTCLINELRLLSIPITYFLNITLLGFIKKLKSLQPITSLFISRYIDCNPYIGSFFTEEVSLNKDSKYMKWEKDFAYQTGMDILSRMNCTIEIAKVLLKEKKYGEFLLFARKKKFDLKPISKEDKKNIINFLLKNSKNSNFTLN